MDKLTITSTPTESQAKSIEQVSMETLVQDYKKRDLDPSISKTTFIDTLHDTLEMSVGTLQTGGGIFNTAPLLGQSNRTLPINPSIRKVNNIARLDVVYGVTLDRFQVTTPTFTPSSDITVPIYLSLLKWNENYNYEVNVLGLAPYEDTLKLEVFLNFKVGDWLYNHSTGYFYFNPVSDSVNLLDTLPARPIPAQSAGINFPEISSTYPGDQITENQKNEILNGTTGHLLVDIVADTTALGGSNKSYIEQDIMPDYRAIVDFNVEYIGTLASF